VKVSQTGTPTTPTVERRGKKREREEVGVGVVGGVNGGAAPPKSALNAKAGLPGIRPKKKQRVVSVYSGRHIPPRYLPPVSTLTIYDLRLGFTEPAEGHAHSRPTTDTARSLRVILSPCQTSSSFPHDFTRSRHCIAHRGRVAQTRLMSGSPMHHSQNRGSLTLHYIYSLPFAWFSLILFSRTHLHCIIYTINYL
jgi:hypothetical protein